jgi:ATP-dependent RNA helicase
MEETKKVLKAKPGDKDEKSTVYETSEDIKVIQNFEELGLRSELLKGIYAYGFNKPSAVQQRAILPILQGRDVVVQSQSGTGKTCVFCVGGLQSINLSVREPQVLILSPTRELAEQNQKVCLALGDAMNVIVNASLIFRCIAVLAEEV